MSSRTPTSTNRPLSYDDTYLCPICRHGELRALVLMDAFGCDFCRHIFTANLSAQILRAEDSSPPMNWRWNGLNWQSVLQGDGDLSTLVWLFSLGIVVLPPLLVWLPLHTFPPAAGSRGSWLPTVWLLLTALLHGAGGSWLMAEHHQWAPYIGLKARWRRWALLRQQAQP
jgi:hypothetical protein